MVATTPNAVFTYGTLMPGQPRWPSLSRYLAGMAEPAAVRGNLLDTGAGYPALANIGRGPWVPGFLVPLDPAQALKALNVLDVIEGTAVGLYERVLVRTRAGFLAWTYEYRRSTADMVAVPAGRVSHVGIDVSW